VPWNRALGSFLPCVGRPPSARLRSSNAAREDAPDCSRVVGSFGRCRRWMLATAPKPHGSVLPWLEVARYEMRRLAAAQVVLVHPIAKDVSGDAQQTCGTHLVATGVF